VATLTKKVPASAMIAQPGQRRHRRMAGHQQQAEQELRAAADRIRAGHKRSPRQPVGDHAAGQHEDHQRSRLCAARRMLGLTIRCRAMNPSSAVNAP
jgi:hypothetical protein